MSSRSSDVRPFFPQPLLISKVIAPLKHKRNIIQAIEEIGEVEPIEVDPRTGIDEIQIEQRRNLLESYRTRLDNILSELNDKKIQHNGTVSIEGSETEVMKYLEDIVIGKGAAIEKILKRKREIEDRIGEVEALLDLLQKFSTLEIEDTSILHESSHVKTFLGTIFPAQLTRLFWEIDEVTDHKYLMLEKEITKQDTIVLLSVLRKDEDVVENKLKTLNFSPITIPRETEFEGLTPEDCKLEIHNLTNEMEQLNKDLDFISSESGFDFIASKEVVTIELQRISVEQKMRRTQSTCVMWAWLPTDRQNEFQTKIETATDGSANVDFRKGDFDPQFSPTYVKNSEFMAPMRSLVTSFGTPGINEIDPYKFVAVFFPILFGIMYADVGNGLTLLLVGIWAKRKKDKMTEIPKGLSGFLYGGPELLIIMGATSTLFGIPFNSFFGDETILWQVPIFKTLFENTTWAFFFTTEKVLDQNGAVVDIYIERNYVNFLIFSFVVGIIMIFIGLLLNLYQLFYYRKSQADWYAGLTLFGTFFFGVTTILLSAIGPTAMLIGALLTIFSLLSTLIIEGRAHGIDGIMLGVDHLLSLFSNTLSFGRLLAMNTIHFVLTLLPYLFAELFFPNIHVLNESVLRWEVDIGIWIILAMIGNLIVVPVETVFSSLQSLRLNWVEFFGKFYKGNGIQFNPIKAKRIYTFEAV